MDHAEVLTLAEADASYQLRSVFDLAHADDDNEVVLLRGGAALEHLPLDFHVLDAWSGLPRRHPNALLGVVVDGDLKVTDWIVNWETDFGPFLFVRGDLRAANLATAGSQVLVRGALEVEQTLAGYYNHGRTIAEGGVRAQVVLTQEHLMQIHGELTAQLVVADNVLELFEPGPVAVDNWAGVPRQPGGTATTRFGTPSHRALRMLDPDLDSLDRQLIFQAAQAGRTLLRPDPGPPPADGTAPVTLVDTVRDVLRRAGCAEHERFGDGFCLDVEDPDDTELLVSFNPADQGIDGLNPATELRSYHAALTAAGYRISAHPENESFLRVLP